MTNTREPADSSLTASRLLLLAAVIVCTGLAVYSAAHAQTPAGLLLDEVERALDAAQDAGADDESLSKDLEQLERGVQKFRDRVAKNLNEKPEKLRPEANFLINRANSLISRANKPKAQSSATTNSKASPNSAATPTPTPRGTPGAAETTPQDANTVDKGDKGSGEEGLLSYAPSLRTILLMVSSLALLTVIALAVWFVVRLNRRVGELEGRNNKVVQRLKNMEGVVVEQKNYAQGVNVTVTQLREEMSRELEEVRRSYRDIRVGQRPAPAPAPAAANTLAHFDGGPTREPGPTFPSLVSDYLNKVSDTKKLEVEADFRTNLFVPAQGGPFVLVQDDDGTGSGIVLPKSRLQKSQEFVSYYKGTYYCDSPSAGEVFVLEPAVVDNAGGGWRLRSPGRLELR